MPRSIADIRKSAGGLENLTDEDILQATYQKYKAYYPTMDAYASEIGYAGAGRSLTGSRISAGVDQYQANLLGLGGAVSRAVGAPGMGESFDRRREVNESAAAYAAQRARDLGGIEDFRDVTGVGSGLNYIGGLAAQSLPYAGEAVAGALTGGATLAGTAARVGLGRMAARTAGAVGAGYPSAVGDILSNQREAGGERLGAAAAGGIPYAALNAVGLEGQLARGLRPLVQGAGSPLRRLVVGVPASALGEGASETGQELINQYAGRMAIDPNETLFNPEANKRYLDSFVGGAALGGVVGGAGSLRRPYQAPEQETNLLTPEQPASPQYGLITQPAPLQTRINEQLGIGAPRVAGKKYVSQFEEAYNEPSGQYAQDAVTGLERELTVGELMQSGIAPLDLTVANPAGAAAVNIVAAKVARDPRSAELRDTFGVIPTPKALQLYTEITESGVPADSDILTGVWSYAAKKPISSNAQLEKARNLLDAAIIESRKGPTNVSISTTPVPAIAPSVATGGPFVRRGVGPTGPSATGNLAPNTGPVVTGTAAGQAQPISISGGQRATPVAQGPTTRGAAGTTPLVDTSDDALEIARATGNAAEIEAMREDEAGLRADRTALTDDDLSKVVNARFAKSKNAKRDTEILNAYLTALRADAGTDKAVIQNRIGDRYGITAVAVRKIGNPTKLVEAGAELGFSPEQVLDLFNVDDNTKAQFTEIGKLETEIRDLRKAYNKAADADKRNEVADRMAALSERITKIKEKASEEKSAAFSAGLQEAGISSVEGESAGFGFDTEREWTRVENESKVASTILELSNQIESLQETAAQLDAQGQSEAADAARDAIANRQAKIDAVLADIAAETKPAAKREVAADLATAKAKFKEAKYDPKQMGVEDLKLLREEAKRFNNKAMIDKIDASLSARMTETEFNAVKGTPSAVQVKSPTSVSVQPKAEASQGVGTEVRSTEKPASKGEVAVLTPQEQYEKVTAGFPVPVWTNLTQSQQGQLADLARRDQLNLAAVNRFVAAQVTDESNIIDVEARVIDETVKPQIAKLAAPQIDRLEKHYGVGRDTAEFLAKVKEDIVLYATKGAQAVNAAVRDIIRNLQTGVLSVALIFNPMGISQAESFIVIPQETQVTTQVVQAKVPAEVKGMSDAGKQAYATLVPALKAKNYTKFITIADKPSGKVFVFKADGSLVMQKKALFGLAKGDLYKGNNDLPSNRVTPAGLFGIKVIDAAQGGGAAKTAGDYDFGKVFALEDPDAVVTFMHSVWLKESDAPKRAAALKNESAADSRYSFGCINLDKETFRQMVSDYATEMDGSKLFVVPDVQSTVGDFLSGNVANDRLVRESVQPTTKTVTTPVRSATQTAGADRTVTGKEEKFLFGKAPEVTKPYTAQQLLAEIKDFVRADIPGRKLQVFNSIEDMLQSPLDDLRALAKVINDQSAYGVAVDGTAYLIANRIQQGRARSTFLHEVGAHLGLEKLLPNKLYDTLVDQLVEWGKKNDGSLESQIAQRAAKRVKAAKTPKEDQAAELLAYFIEEAVDAGINPTAADKLSGPIGAWFRTLWAAFKVAIRRLGFKPETLSASDVVNLAYGAARLEVSGTWHGTAANFNKFSNKFMGAGEGNQAYGWGAYVAQLKGIAKGYWRDDVRRKEKDNYQAELNKFIGYKFDQDVIHPEDRTLAIYKGFELTETSVPAVARKLAQFGVDEVNLVAPDGVTYTVELGAPEGNLLRVDLAISPDESLDWGLPMASQSQLVRDVFDKFTVEVLKRPKPDWSKAGRFRGADYYMDMGMALTGIDPTTKQEMAKVQKAASEWLDANGVKGIRYYDAVSRTDQLNLSNAQFIQDGNTLAGADALRKEYFKPGEIIQGYDGPDKVISYNENGTTGWSVTVVAVDNKGEPRKGERPRTHFTEPSFKEVKAILENRGWKLSDDARTYNSVVFNEKNMLRVSSARGADRQRMRFGSGEQKPPRLEKRENGRVIDLIVDGQTAESFELASKGLWDRFGGDEEKILRGNDAQAAKEKAYKALRSAEYAYRQEGPLNRVEQITLDDLERGDLEGLRARMPLLFDGGQLRYDIGKLISHAVYNPDTPISASAPEAKYAPKWVLGQAARPAQPAASTVGGTSQSPQKRQPGMRFGKNAPDQGFIAKNVAKLPKQAQTPVKNSINTISDWARKGLDNLVFTSSLINRAVDAGIKSASTFESLLAKRSTKARSLEREVERIADMYAGIEEANKGDRDNSVNQFIFESTRTGKWGYGKYRDATMGAAFDKLGPKAKKYVEAMFAHGEKILAAKKKAVVDYATSEYDARIAAETDPIKKARAIRDKVNDLKTFASLFRIREGIPYAPIKRFGDHVVVAKSKAYIDAVAADDKTLITKLEKDPDHYHVSFTETKNEARNLTQQLQDQGFFSGGTVAFKERSVAEKELFGNSDSLNAITRLRAVADANANAGEKGAAQMQRMVSDMYLQALAEGSARKSEMRRRGVSGEIDMLRSFAAQGRADANFIASVEYNPQVQDAIQAMNKESNQGSGDLNRKSELRNEITRRYESSLDAVPTPTIAKVTRLSSVYYLATSPAYYLQNLTQPWMMSVPSMAGRHDYGKTSTALFAAYGQLGDVMKSARYDQQFDFDKVPADVRDAIQELANRGKIDIGLETELGEFKIEGDGAFSKGWNKVDKFLRVAVQKVESLNRLSTAMAAYRLELAKTGSKEDAVNYADRILTETHGDYSSFNAPRIFNTSFGKVALQFRKFQLIQLSYYAKLLKDAGFNTEEKRAASKALAYSLGHTGLMAGAMGLPGYSAIAWAIGALFGDDDEPLDVTAELRKFIGDETVANLIMRGAPTLAGVDISGKVGAGNALSIMPFSNADLTTKAGVIEAVGTLVGGAPIGMVARVADGVGQMMSGEWYKGMEQILPKGLGDAAKAYRIWSEGMTRRNGDIVLPASEVSAWEGLVQAMGIQPVQQSVIMERQQNTWEMNQFYQDRSTKVKAQYIKAVRNGEPTGEARAAWMKLQEARVKNGYARQPLSELLRAPQSQAKREKQVVGGVQFNKTNKRFVEEQI